MKEHDRAVAAVDLALGLGSQAVGTAVVVGRTVWRVGEPTARVVLAPRLLPARLHPATWIDGAVRQGALRREELVRRVAELLDVVVPAIVVALVRRIDLTALVRDHVDLDGVMLEVDLDAVASRLDVDAVAARLDIDAVLQRIDLNEVVRRGVDLNGLVAIVDINAAAARLDVEAVIQRVDLVGLARGVLAEIDLPEIIRESTGSMASDTVRGVRMQTISADDAVGRAVDRLRLRRPRRVATEPPPPGAP